MKHIFQISRDSCAIQNNIVVFLKNENGISGLGEAAPSLFMGENVNSVIKMLRQSIDFLKHVNPFHIEDITLQLENKFPHNPAARAAIDIALHDVAGKQLKVPLYKLFGLNPLGTKTTSFTIGIDTMEKMCKKVDEVKDYPLLKIKVGRENDIEILKELRKITNAIFRVDANMGWAKEDVQKKINRMEELGVELVEQPLPIGSFETLKKIKQLVNIPIILDEDVKNSKDIPEIASAADGINIKLMKCGGIREAMRMIHTARAHDLKIMIGCNIESSISITAAAHVTPLVDYVDLDGHLLVTNDPYRGVAVDKGKLVLPEGDGLGVVQKDEE
ncbi:MAG: dipeptide epimerase [Candidatus Brocadiaceae bacterium]|nr:dipeptide epimerase [Candidatus Brocadiaceae bacterium]